MLERPGQLLRLRGLRTAQLPALDATPDVLAPFLISILQEAVPFIDSVAPKAASRDASKEWRRRRSKSHADSAASVELFHRTVAAGGEGEGEGEGDTRESWICRRSVHQDAAAKGTASWAEFRDCFKERHVETEDAFTPTVTSAKEEVKWDCAGVVRSLQRQQPAPRDLPPPLFIYKADRKPTKPARPTAISPSASPR